MDKIAADFSVDAIFISPTGIKRDKAGVRQGFVADPATERHVPVNCKKVLPTSVRPRVQERAKNAWYIEFGSQVGE
ncbi:hypothetical protein [Amycolatopsis echigonensis]|uniref:Uncharacterized protein n=1 Tax=Amycolatopsis echigonensis TaxID=2576905 RepID=A0A8E2B6H0_9PSEU|nr:hypothetical protein [Amycolatopsis echigonensis]MBB2503639.1 hypothetical protein [Amycolatopsis echigonensis]